MPRRWSPSGARRSSGWWPASTGRSRRPRASATSPANATGSSSGWRANSGRRGRASSACGRSFTRRPSAPSLAGQAGSPPGATVRATEEANTTLTAEIGEARAALESARAIVEALEDEATRARADIDQLEAAAHTVAAEQERLEARLEEARARAAESTRRLEA